MSRTQRVSNGELPNYGRQHHNPLQQTEQWRARCKNERTGSHKTVRMGSMGCGQPCLFTARVERHDKLAGRMQSSPFLSLIHI